MTVGRQGDKLSVGRKAAIVFGLALTAAGLAVTVSAGYRFFAERRPITVRAGERLQSAQRQILTDILKKAPGRAKEAYSFALGNRRSLSKLSCECGCTHGSVYGCFFMHEKGKLLVNEHGAECKECIDRALAERDKAG